MINTLGGVRWQAKSISDISVEQAQELWELSNSLITETLSSFMRHVKNCETCYIFKNLKSNQIVGFSFWRLRETPDPHIKVVSQRIISIRIDIAGKRYEIDRGKLRLSREYRRRSLHVIAGLRFYFEQQWKYPRANLYFLSVASLFNYVSMTKGVRDFELMLQGNNPPTTTPISYLYVQLGEHMREEGFEFGPNGEINVRIKPKPEVLAEYPDSYYQLPASVEYIRKNPNWKEGYDLAYMYPFTLINVLFMIFRVLEHTYRVWKTGS